MVGLTEISIQAEGAEGIWTVTGVGEGGRALANLSGAAGEAVSIEGFLPRNGVCGPGTCIERRAPGVRSTPRPSDEAVRLSADAAAPIEITGEIVQVRWTHPNTMIHMRLANGSTWRVAGVSPGALERGGLFRDDLLPGREIVVSGHRSTDRSCAPECKAVGAAITLAGWARHPTWRFE
jgi:hypothetical protein